ncbi:MAG: hypothetical protein U9R01_04880 [candidate division WOR-3 bacterium]|nr:hypothetical protein [candidate division WOR-3 bacterium]
MKKSLTSFSHYQKFGNYYFVHCKTNLVYPKNPVEKKIKIPPTLSIKKIEGMERLHSLFIFER